MSETTAPTGGSNVRKANMSEAKVVKTAEDYEKLLGFEVAYMDFAAKGRDEKNLEENSGTGDTSGASDTATPIVPGNTAKFDAQKMGVIFSNPETIVTRPVQNMKKKDKSQKKEETTQENDSREA